MDSASVNPRGNSHAAEWDFGSEFRMIHAIFLSRWDVWATQLRYRPTVGRRARKAASFLCKDRWLADETACAYPSPRDHDHPSATIVVELGEGDTITKTGPFSLSLRRSPKANRVCECCAVVPASCTRYGRVFKVRDLRRSRLRIGYICHQFDQYRPMPKQLSPARYDDLYPD